VLSLPGKHHILYEEPLNPQRVHAPSTPIPPIIPKIEGLLSDSGEDLQKDSTVIEPVKKVGRHTNKKKRETKANKEKNRRT
jgi:hypothetical protein